MTGCRPDSVDWKTIPKSRFPGETTTADGTRGDSPAAGNERELPGTTARLRVRPERGRHRRRREHCPSGWTWLDDQRAGPSGGTWQMAGRRASAICGETFRERCQDARGAGPPALDAGLLLPAGPSGTSAATRTEFAGDMLVEAILQSAAARQGRSGRRFPTGSGPLRAAAPVSWSSRSTTESRAISSTAASGRRSSTRVARGPERLWRRATRKN